MKTIPLFIAVLFHTFILSGQTAQETLDKAAKKMQSFTSMNAIFNYSLQNSAAKINESYTGSILIKGDHYNLHLLDINQIYDGSKTYTINKLDKELTIVDANDQDLLLTPTKILSSYKTGFSSTLGKKEQDVQYIDLKPQGQSTTKQVTIGIRSDYILYSVTEENTEGTKTTIKITNFIPNFPILDSQLKVNIDQYKKRGYMIID